MSTPENPLAKYRVYSYHQILLICDNVDTATTISQSTNLSTFLVQNSSESANNIVVKTTNTGGKYVVLLNGMTDSDFVISKLEWESIVSSSSSDNNGADKNTSVDTEGTMLIEEPRGVRFFNAIRDSYKVLEIDNTTAVWMMKTIFVGHKDDQANGSITDYITNINPLIFTPIEITSEFSETGGVYNLAFFNIANGSAKMPQVSKITETIKLNTNDVTTLEQTIGKLQEIIKKKYDLYYDSVAKDITAAGAVPKRVQYIIKLDKHYTENAERYQIVNGQPQNTQEGTANSGIILDFSKEITLENSLKLIMRKCPQVQKDVKGTNDADGRRFGYKIRSVLNSNREAHIIQYVINRYEIIDSSITKKITDGNAKELEENTIVFDYIFSGKNTDILDFNLKMELGMVFFQQLISSNTLGNQKQTVQGRLTVSDQPGINKPAHVNNISDNEKITKPVVPVYFTTTVKNPTITNDLKPKEAIEYQSLLSRHAALENINVMIKIAGNPSLLNSVNKLPSDFTGDDIKNVSQIDGENNDAFPHWELVPALAKINIFMPSTKEDDNNFSEKFWYDGLYQIFSIKTTFDSGLFTQELEMLSLPQAQAPGNAEEPKDKSEDNTLADSSSSSGTNTQNNNTKLPNIKDGPVSQILNRNSTKTNNNLR